jgi:hypothetical protein
MGVREDREVNWERIIRVEYRKRYIRWRKKDKWIKGIFLDLERRRKIEGVRRKIKNREYIKVGIGRFRLE